MPSGTLPMSMAISCHLHWVVKDYVLPINLNSIWLSSVVFYFLRKHFTSWLFKLYWITCCLTKENLLCSKFFVHLIPLPHSVVHRMSNWFLHKKNNQQEVVKDYVLPINLNSNWLSYVVFYFLRKHFTIQALLNSLLLTKENLPCSKFFVHLISLTRCCTPHVQLVSAQKSSKQEEFNNSTQKYVCLQLVRHNSCH